MIVFIDEQAPTFFYIFEAALSSKFSKNHLKTFYSYGDFIRDFERNPEAYEALRLLVLDIRVPEVCGQLCFMDGRIVDLVPSYEALGFLGAIDRESNFEILKKTRKVVLTQLSVDAQTYEQFALYDIDKDHIFDKYSESHLSALKKILEQSHND